MAWDSLLSIIAKNKAERESEQVVACPNDGTTLKTGPNGELYCPFDGWQP